MKKPPLQNDWERVFLALGANLGEPLVQIDAAVLALSEQSQINCIAMSPVYLSKPHGSQDQPDYMNAVMEIRTSLTPNKTLELLHKIENYLGRKRKIRWGARTLDLDIVLFGHVQMASEQLTIPHPRAHQREFVVKPLFDLDKDLSIPPHGKLSVLLQQLPVDTLEIVRDVKTHYS